MLLPDMLRELFPFFYWSLATAQERYYYRHRPANYYYGYNPTYQPYYRQYQQQYQPEQPQQQDQGNQCNYEEVINSSQLPGKIQNTANSLFDVRKVAADIIANFHPEPIEIPLYLLQVAQYALEGTQDLTNMLDTYGGHCLAQTAGTAVEMALSNLQAEAQQFSSVILEISRYRQTGSSVVMQLLSKLENAVMTNVDKIIIKYYSRKSASSSTAGQQPTSSGDPLDAFISATATSGDGSTGPTSGNDFTGPTSEVSPNDATAFSSDGSETFTSSSDSAITDNGAEVPETSSSQDSVPFTVLTVSYTPIVTVSESALPSTPGQIITNYVQTVRTVILPRVMSLSDPDNGDIYPSATVITADTTKSDFTSTRGLTTSPEYAVTRIELPSGVMNARADDPNQGDN